MPIYEYRCLSGHVTEQLRKLSDRYEMALCHCGYLAERIEISHNHVMPSGMYSYLPNVGSARQFERRQQALKDGTRIYRKEAD
jgi:putative FmdB family regulatory protein